MMLLSLPCVAQILVFRQHSANHDFSALKFELTFAAVTFVLLPVTIMSVLQENPIKRQLPGMSKVATAMLAASILYAIIEFPAYKREFPPPTDTFNTVGAFISRATRFEDMVFSTTMEVPATPPQWLSYTMKRVYRIRSAAEIYKNVRGISADYVVDLLVENDKLHTLPEDLEALIRHADKVRKSPSVTLYALKKTTFLNFARCFLP